ncbi:MAG: hypothetical protein EHM68_12210 [Lysobacterales bacterium]|nr:MAG: hypothetical protein EHM68_12210 [Xanthomonadales bacterium]
MGEPLATLRIDSRFRGPPRSGNGGYVCGRLAEFIQGDCRVRLLRPPPLDRELTVVADENGASLMDGEQVIAQARPQALELTLPAPVSLAEARALSPHFRGFEAHAFHSCFVCGPERAAGDGLRIFPGATDDGSRVASPWRPDSRLAGADGLVRSRYVWAALDCPSGWAYLHPGGRVAVLGQFAAHIETPIPVEEDLVVIGWLIDDAGRKHHCGSALFSADGEPLAWAAATWFDVDLENFAA